MAMLDDVSGRVAPDAKTLDRTVQTRRVACGSAPSAEAWRWSLSAPAQCW